MTQIGTIIDETGCISPGQLVFSPQAWEQLLGASEQDLIRGGTPTLKAIENRMLFARVTLGFCWAEEVGRLAILEVLA